MGELQLVQRHDLTLLVCPPLERPGFIHAFSTRRGGVSPLPEKALNLGYFEGDAPENVTENRRRLLKAIGAPQMKLVAAKQIHSAEIVVIHQDHLAAAPRACDALITNAPDVLLGVQTADCVPILIADLKRRVVAAVHAGWRGTLARICEKTITRMRAEFGTRPQDCLAAIGPSASACCYEVGRDVIDSFRSKFTDAQSIISNHKPNGKAHLDLPMCNARQLSSAGLPESTIFTSGFCTLCRNDLFFSHRLERDRGVGRMMSVIGVALKSSALRQSPPRSAASTQ